MLAARKTATRGKEKKKRQKPAPPHMHSLIRGNPLSQLVVKLVLVLVEYSRNRG